MAFQTGKPTVANTSWTTHAFGVALCVLACFSNTFGQPQASVAPVQPNYWVGAALGLGLIILGFVYFNLKKRLANNRHKLTQQEQLVNTLQTKLEAANGANKELEHNLRSVQSTLEKMREQQTEIMDSINYASVIQQSVLPQRKILQDAFNDCFILNKPRNVVSGDFYWMRTQNDLTYLLVGDCTGHGVPGAFLSILSVAFLNDYFDSLEPDEFPEANQVLMKIREYMIKTLNQDRPVGPYSEGMDAVVCIFNHKDHSVQFAGAYNPLILIDKNGELAEIKGDKSHIGLYSDSEVYFKNHNLVLAGPTNLYLFSDGYCDQLGGEKGRKFYLRRFKELLQEIQSHDMSWQKQLIDQANQKWMDDLEQMDDILVIGIKF